MVMSLYDIVASTGNSSLNMKDIEEAFDGNLCRCIGYRPILDVAKTFVNDFNTISYEKSPSSTNTSTSLDKYLQFAQQNFSSLRQVVCFHENFTIIFLNLFISKVISSMIYLLIVSIFSRPFGRLIPLCVSQ